MPDETIWEIAIRSGSHIDATIEISFSCLIWADSVIYILASIFVSDEEYIATILHSIWEKSILHIFRIDTEFPFYIFTSEVTSFLREFPVEVEELGFHLEDFCFLDEVCLSFILFIGDTVWLILEAITEYTFATSDQISREPYIRRASDKSWIENIVRLDDPTREIDILRVIPYHHTIEYIRYVILDIERVEYILTTIDREDREVDLIRHPYARCMICISTLVIDESWWQRNIPK